MILITENPNIQNGYSKVVRELGKALNAYMPVRFGTGGNLSKDDFILTRPYFQNPFRFNTEARIIGHYALESTRLPERLVRECNDDRMYQVWVPSDYCKTIAVNNGVIEDKIRIVPHGYDTTIFYDKKTLGEVPFTFLFVGGYTGKGDRKGADLIAEASKKLYGHTTQPFVVKFKINTIYGGFPESDLKSPNHTIDTTNYTDEEMGEVYRTADCFITASQGEAFNMTLLEAMACGMPCISPLNTGERDFGAQIDYPLLQFEEVPAKFTPWDIGLWFKPDVDEIIEKMKQVLKDNPQKRTYDLKGFTWDEVAKKVVECLQR